MFVWKGNTKFINTSTTEVASVQLALSLLAVGMLINYMKRCNLDDGALIIHCA